jgi:predicted DsbA family dithiol-disulfide isomerase
VGWKERGERGVDHDMRVEIWSDVACPWCYVGTRRFERAVEETGIDVEVVYRAFELDPTVPVGVESPPLTDYLARKFGDRSRVQAAHARLTDAGAELGIDFRWAGMRRANTFDAHRLLTWALETTGSVAQRALKTALLRAYFTDGLDVADRGVLADLAAEVGLDRSAADDVLESERYADEVRAERYEAHRNGIAAVPTFVVEGQWMLQGAHDTSAWVKALRHMSDDLAAST